MTERRHAPSRGRRLEGDGSMALVGSRRPWATGLVADRVVVTYA